MTKGQKATAINKLELPPDYMDRFWPIFWGFVPVVICVFTSTPLLIIFLSQQGKLQLFLLIFPVIFWLQFFLCIYYRVTERKLKIIKTGLSNYINERIIEKAATSLGWEFHKEENYISVRKSFAFGYNAYLIKVITDRDSIYYNIRMQGTYKGRMMHSFGFETLRRWQFVKKIRFFINEEKEQIQR